MTEPTHPLKKDDALISRLTGLTFFNFSCLSWLQKLCCTVHVPLELFFCAVLGVLLLLLQCTPDNGEMVKREFRIKGKVPRKRISDYLFLTTSVKG